MSANRPRTSGQQVRDLGRQLTALESEPAGPDRARQLAALARTAHDDRHLNLAMRAAAGSLADDPEAPAALLAAYDHGEGAGSGDDGEQHLSRLVDLRDLGGYLDHAGLRARAAERLATRAHEWVLDADPAERRYRLRTVESLADLEVADRIRTALETES